MDPLSLLVRKDKWFLGGGRGALFAPPFPRHLASPGFWDESYFADIRLTRLFTVLFTDFEGRPIRLRSEVVDWRPDRLILVHRSENHVVHERRCLTESNAWVSELTLESGDDLQAFVWSLPELREAGYGAPWQSLSDAKVASDALSFEWQTAWPCELEPDRTGVEDERVRGGTAGMLGPLSLFVEIGASAPRQSFTVNLAQRHDDSPLWETSLLPQKLRNGRLPGDEKVFVGPPPTEGLVHLLQQYILSAGEPLVVACGVGLTSRTAKAALQDALAPDVIERSERDWRAYFASVPQFSSSDPYLTNSYWYRWYGLRLNTVDIEGLPVSRTDARTTFSPFVTEGIGFFRNFVTYSAQAHLREAAWMHSPRLALGILENLAKCQREDGSFPGHNYSCRPPRDFYHADFATGTRFVEQLHNVVPGGETTKMLSRYFEYLIRERGHVFDVANGTFTETWPESAYRAPMMILIFDQNETGQEYMSRYQFACETADQWASFRVCGVDATHYGQTLARHLARRAVDKESRTRLSHLQHQLLDGLSYISFDGNDFFCDVLPDQTRSNAHPATGLYPLDNEAYLLWHNNGIPLEKVFEGQLSNPNEFWIERGFPATAFSDPAFDADSEWKGKRLNCSWSGRSWPMANSHVVDAAAHWARVQTAELQGMRTAPEAVKTRHKAGEALMKAITLMFHDGDPARPNSYEHYDPITGTPSLYRGYDDYMHSWIVDLIMRHAVGVQPGKDKVDPLPLGVDWIECTDIPHPNGRMSVRIEHDQVVYCSIA